MPGFRISPPTDPRYTFVGSDYGPRPSRSTGRTDFHPGLDFNFNRDAAQEVDASVRSAFDVHVHAVADGKVVYAGYDSSPASMNPLWTRGYGNCIVLEHTGAGPSPVGGSWYTLYAHLRDMRVRVGDIVQAGLTIGRVGASMNQQFEAMGPHLHFEVRTALRAPARETGKLIPMPATNDPAFRDWQVGRATFQTRPGVGVTVDPIWWFEQRGVRILREPEVVSGVERRRGQILVGATSLAQGIVPESRRQDYQAAQPPEGASYTARRRALAGLGAEPPPESMTTQVDMTRTSSSGSTTTTITGSTEPYQPPIAGRLYNPLIPVTDPDTQAPPAPYAVAAVAAVGAGVALAAAYEIVREYQARRG